MSKIIRLTVKNMLRLEAAEITPDGALVIVAGDNDQGKSSLLNCIALALSGKNVPAQPIKQGASTGEIVLETESLVVTRTFRAASSPILEVRDKEGVRLTAPQAKLDALYSLTTFDPLTFTRYKAQEQATVLRDLAGLDTAELDREHAEKYGARTMKGREVDAQKGRVAAINRDSTAPAEFINVADLSRELQDANTKNAENAKKRESLADLNDVIAETQTRVRNATIAIEELEKELAKAQHYEREAIAARDTTKTEVESLADVDTAAIVEQIQNAETINNAVRANAQWKVEHSALIKLQGEYQALTERIASIAGTKESRIAKAKLPIEGLGLSDDGVTFEGVPFEQCSSSKQIRVSLAIACALNPQLRVMLIRDGSLLDKTSLALVQEFAEKHDAQVFMECVGHRDDATVIIEAGNVVATPAADAKAAKKKGAKA